MQELKFPLSEHSSVTPDHGVEEQEEITYPTRKINGSG